MPFSLADHQVATTNAFNAYTRAMRTMSDKGWSGIMRRQATSDYLDALDAFSAAFPQDAALLMQDLDPTDD